MDVLLVGLDGLVEVLLGLDVDLLGLDFGLQLGLDGVLAIRLIRMVHLPARTGSRGIEWRVRSHLQVLSQHLFIRFVVLIHVGIIHIPEISQNVILSIKRL